MHQRPQLLSLGGIATIKILCWGPSLGVREICNVYSLFSEPHLNLLLNRISEMHQRPQLLFWGKQQIKKFYLIAGGEGDFQYAYSVSLIHQSVCGGISAISILTAISK